MQEQKNKEENTSPGSMKRFIAALIAVSLFIVLYAIFGTNGILDVLKIKADKESITEQNRFLEEENKRLAQEIRRLKEDKEYIAKVANRELGMIGKDNVIYKIDKDKADPRMGSLNKDEEGEEEEPRAR